MEFSWMEFSRMGFATARFAMAARPATSTVFENIVAVFGEVFRSGGVDEMDG